MNKKDKVSLVPKLRFPEFKINGPINLEKGNVIFESISNKNHNSDLPVLAITQEHGAIPRDQIDYNVSVTDKSLESYKVVEIGDFIISLRSFQGGIEYSSYYGICSPAYIILRKKTPIEEEYYRYYFKTNKFIQDLNKDLEGIRDGKMVSYSQFSSILLPKPENKEQKKVAECLSSLEEVITTEVKKLEAFRAHKKGLMQKLFPAKGETIPELRFPEFRGSSKWEQRKLGDVCTSISSGKSKKSTGNGIFPLIGSTGQIGFCDSADYNGELILIARVGANAGQVNFYVGECGVSDNTLILDIDSASVNGLFLRKWLDNFNVNKLIFGSGQPLITGGQLKSVEISIPPLTEQRKIADCLSALDTLIITQTEKIETLKAHKKGLMQGLYSSIEEVSE